LAFPDLQRDRPEDFLHQASSLKDKPDLLVLPENAYTITGETIDQLTTLSSKIQAFANQTGIGLIAGVGVGGTAGTRLTWLHTDNWALMAKPGEAVPLIYHKHTASLRTAFDDKDWSEVRTLPLFELKGERIALGVNQDISLSPLYRRQACDGASLLINISHANMRPALWRSQLQAHAVTNGLTVLGVAHRDTASGRPQRAIYAMGPQGEFNLLSARGARALQELEAKQRTGQLYLHDTKNPVLKAGISLMASRQDWEGNASVSREGIVQGKHRQFKTITAALPVFLHQPELLWGAALKLPLGVIPAFRILTTQAEYAAQRAAVQAVAVARVAEFGAIAVFQDTQRPLAVCYQGPRQAFFSEATGGGRLLAIDESSLQGPSRTLELINSTGEEGNNAMTQRNFRNLVRRLTGAHALVQ